MLDTSKKKKKEILGTQNRIFYTMLVQKSLNKYNYINNVNICAAFG